MANLKELSEILGLSQTTVSRALNGYPEVAERTRKRVADAARKHNYTPNPGARGLATGKARTIGHVIPLSGESMMNPHFSDVISAVGRVCQQRGYDMLLSVVDEAEHLEAYQKLKADRRVDGVIVHLPLSDDPRIDLLQTLNIPFVVHGRTLGNEDEYAWVDIDNRHAFLEATRHLIELGHRRIAFMNGMADSAFAHLRREGYGHAMGEAGLKVDEGLLSNGEMTEPLGHSEMMRLLDLDEPPTAVLCSSTVLATGALRALQEHSLTVGKDVSLVAHDDELSFMLADTGDTRMTVVRSAISKAGAAAADMLIDMIEEEKVPKSVLLEAQFIKGNTSGPPHPPDVGH
ncbi:MAG: substrate-binding domain-containing protein [Pseudomonadota bacterium]